MLESPQHYSGNCSTGQPQKTFAAHKLCWKIII